MARNLDEPGATFDQLLELALNLKNARAFAGKIGDYDWKEGDWTDPEDVDLYDWEPKPEKRIKLGEGTMPEHLTEITLVDRYKEMLHTRLLAMEASSTPPDQLDVNSISNYIKYL